MSGVDDSIVSIKFDNKAFEQNVASTIASLDKLRASLDFANATKGMDTIGAAAKNVDMSTLGNAVEGISAKFIGLTTVAVTALSQITTGAMQAGAQVAKSLTIGPVGEGFSDYNLKLTSVQTIMNATGKSIEEVNGYFNQLDEYADTTVFNLTDMTSAFAKFTNTGLEMGVSIPAIKGIGNMVALAGQGANEAQIAFYNLSQAMSAGFLSTMDYKSLNLANVATKEWKDQMIAGAEAAGTLKKQVDGTYATLQDDGSFKGAYTAAGLFTEGLSDQWATAQVLTDVLGDYGDKTTDIGKKSFAAAQNVKSLPMMMETLKAAVGTGWTSSFENILGNVTESTELFTGLTNSIGKFLGGIGDSRNEMLKTWHDFNTGAGEMTSRQELFESLGQVFSYIGDLLRPIGEAFRDIFPKTTGEQLVIWTAKFSEFTEKLKVGGDTTKAIKTAFTAFFAVLDIGWEIFKGVVKVVFALVDGVWDLISPILKLAAGGTGVVTTFHDMLTTGGGLESFFSALISVINGVFEVLGGLVGIGIDFVKAFAPTVLGPIGEFFSGLGSIVEGPVEGIKNLTGAIGDFFASLSFGGGREKDAVTKKTEDLEESTSLATKLLDALKNVFGQIGDFFDSIISGIAGAFKGLGGAIADALGSGNFDQVLDIIKTGLLGGILAMLVKFFKNGIKFDFGQGAIIEKLKGILDGVTGSLKALQTQIRADTLIKIATAMGILAIAIVALSLVDAVALAKSMSAIAVGFTEMTAVLLVIDKNVNSSGFKIAAIAAGMVLMAAAMALLVIPIKILSTMGWEELAKGLGAVTLGMLVMSKGMQIIGNSKNLSGVVRAGISMILIAGALIVLAFAIKKFSEMNLIEMGFGLAQAALGIGLLILALKAMPDDVAKKGVGLLILALSLRSLAKVVQLFAGLSFAVLAKGFAAIAIGLNEIGISMQTFPDDMLQKAAGLVVLSAALYIIGKVVEQIGNLPFMVLVKGLVALTAALVVVVGAVNAMEGSAAGVAGLIAAAAGLYIIGKAIQEVGNIPLGELLKGLVGLAAALAVLAIASMAAPAILILGVALVAVGAGLALVGAGVALAGKGFELMAKFGAASMDTLIEAAKAMIRQLPQFIAAFVEGLVAAFVTIADQAPKLIDAVKKVLIALLDAVIEVVPKIAETLGTIIGEFLALVRKKIPDIVKTGFTILMAFLDGLRKNIGQLVTVAAEIITGFLDALAEKVPELVDSLFNLIQETLIAVAFKLGESATMFIPVGKALIDGFIKGLVENLSMLLDWFIGLPGQILDIIKGAFGIQSPSTVFADLGGNLILGFLEGLVNTVGQIMSWFIQLPIDILKWVGDLLGTLVPKGVEIIGGFLAGIVNGVVDVISWFGELPSKILGWVGDLLGTLVGKGGDIIIGFLSGIGEAAKDVIDWFYLLPGKIRDIIPSPLTTLLTIGKNIVTGLWNGMKEIWGNFVSWLWDKIKSLPSLLTDFLGITSPSKVFAEIGKNIMLGLGVGMAKEWRHVDTWLQNTTESIRDTSVEAINHAIDAIANTVDNITEFQPTITPVLDLTEVRNAASGLDSMFAVSTISPSVSTANARLISTTADTTGTANDVPSTAPTEVTFEQNIYSPTALSTNDIYRSTRSQIALAKEELQIA